MKDEALRDFLEAMFHGSREPEVNGFVVIMDLYYDVNGLFRTPIDDEVAVDQPHRSGDVMWIFIKTSSANEAIRRARLARKERQEEGKLPKKKGYTK